MAGAARVLASSAAAAGVRRFLIGVGRWSNKWRGEGIVVGVLLVGGRSWGSRCQIGDSDGGRGESHGA